MNKITTGLAAAGLTALALGAVAPASAAPAPTPSTSAGTVSNPTDDPRVQATPAPHVGQIIAHGERRIAVNGVARGATSVTVSVEGGEGSGLAPVALDRFSFLTDVEHLGKKAVVTAYGPQGPSEGVEIVLELGEDEGATVPPNTPVVHAVSAYDDEHLVIEGTVTYDPSLFSRTEVHASVRGIPVYDFPDENGSFSLRVPVSHAGQTVDVQAFRDGLASEILPVELVETQANTASEVFPLGVDSPTAGSVVTTPDATFAGSGIPNSTIVVTRDEKTSRASSTLCETRVASSGDWSCTSAALPAGDHTTTVTEYPAWKSAATQTAGTAFSVVAQADAYDRAQLPSVSSITIDSRGDLIVRVISHGASEVRLEVGDDVETERAIHGRAAFTLDAELLGQSATLTGIRGDVDGRSLDLPLDLLDAAPVAPLTAPLVHGVTQSEPGRNFLVAATTDYFHDEYVVPSVVAKIDDVFVGAPQATWNGALYLQLGAQHAGKTVELVTTRGLREQSESTFFTLETTEGNTAPETFPLDVTSPTPNEVVPVTTEAFTGRGIPGSTVTVSTTTDDDARAGAPEAHTTVLGDGTWVVELEAPLTPGEHTMTVVESPYWNSLSPLTSMRSFTASEGDEGDPESRALTVDGDGTVSPVGLTTLTGTGHPGATVTLHPFGEGLGGSVSTEVRADGTWSISRGFGPATYTAAVFVQTRGPGADQNVPFPLDGTRASTLVVDGDGTVSPVGLTTLTGTGDAGATVTLHPFGVGRGGSLSTEVRGDGTWSISRGFGPATYTAAVFVQTGGPAADQSVPFPLDGTH